MIRLILEENKKCKEGDKKGQGSEFRVSPWGVLPFDCLRKRGAGSVGSTGRAGKVRRKK